MGLKKDLKKLLQPYYWVNILFSLSYIAAKRIKPICKFVFSEKTECELDMVTCSANNDLSSAKQFGSPGGWDYHKVLSTLPLLGKPYLQSYASSIIVKRESEILFFLLIVVVIRTRKTGSVTMVNYLSSSFIYTKVANLILWFYADARLGIAYGAVFILMGLVLPEPAYAGPENITYFRTGNLDEEIQRDKKITWIVAFYTAWNPTCVNFAPIFAELSAQYALDNFKFGKLDVGRFPEVGNKHRVSDSSLSRQLPTLILFKDGKEAIRRPDIDTTNKLHKFFFSEDNVKAAFDLNNIYAECKNNPLKIPKKLTKKESESESHAKSE